MDIVERIRSRIHDAPMPTEHLLDETADKIESLEKALSGMVDMYVQLVDSGDAGFWNPEKVDEVIAARAALAL